MTTQDDLNNALWEYVYGLLEPHEARALEARITSDPVAARAYSEIRQQADRLAAAARVELPPIPLERPSDDTVVQTSEIAAPSPRAPSGPAPLALRVPQWLLALSAVVLLALTGYAYPHVARLHDPQTLAQVEAAIAAEHSRVLVAGPAELYTTVQNPVTVRVEDALGKATVATVHYQWQESGGRVLAEDAITANEQGVALVMLDGSLASDASQLRCWCEDAAPEQAVALRFPAARDLTRTLVQTDRAAYNPGETLFFRAVQWPTAANLEVAAATTGEAAEYFERPYDMPIKAAQSATAAERGLYSGWAFVPPNAPPGNYHLSARDFYTAPRTSEIFGFDATATKLAKSLAELETENAPRSPVTVDFSTANSALHANTYNDVYFSVRDRQGQPLEIRGKIVDRKEQTVAQVQTDANGVGCFQLLPAQQEAYSLALEGTEDYVVPLPPVADEAKTTLALGKLVLTAKEPLVASVSRAEPSTSPLLVTATSNGASVGQQFVLIDDDGAADSTSSMREVEVPLADDAAGVLEVALYDLNDSPPARVATRYVYREPAKYWQISALPVVAKRTARTEQLVQDETTTTPAPANQPTGEKVSSAVRYDCKINVHDEQHRAGVALLGVRVVEDAAAPPPQVASLFMNWYGGPAVPQLATYSNSHVPPRASEELLAWQLNAATIAQGDLARTDFEHNANELKLGLSVEGNAALETFDPQGRGESLNGTALGRTVPHEPDDTSRAAALPSLADNLPQVATAYLRDVNAWRAAEEVRVRRFAQVILVGSGSLLVGLAMLLVWQLAGRAAIWLPAGSVATATLLLCSVWLGMSLDRPLEITRKAVPNFSPERGLAKLRIEDTEETSYKVARPELDARFKESLFESGEALQREEREVHLPVVIASGGTSASGASEHARERRFAVPYADQWAKKDRPTEFDFARPDPNAEFADELDEQEESLADVRERWEWSHLAGLETISRTSQATVPLREQVPSMLAINQSTNPSQPAASTPATGPDSTAPAPTVYWNPDLVTDKNGQAHVSFELPQRNVRYRIMIDAHGNGRIGSHSQIIVAE